MSFALLQNIPAKAIYGRQIVLVMGFLVLSCLNFKFQPFCLNSIKIDYSGGSFEIRPV